MFLLELKQKKIIITIKHRTLQGSTKQCKRISFSNTSELGFDLDLLDMIRKEKLTPCCMLLREQSLKPAKLSSQQLPNFFCSLVANA